MTTEAEVTVTLNEVLDEALGFFEAFRKMGFAAADIYFGWDAKVAFMILRTQGKEFVAICGPRNGATDSELHDKWQAKAVWWNLKTAATARERQEIWNHCLARRHAVNLITGLLSKGIMIPSSSGTLTVA